MTLDTARSRIKLSFCPQYMVVDSVIVFVHGYLTALILGYRGKPINFARTYHEGVGA